MSERNVALSSGHHARTFYPPSEGKMDRIIRLPEDYGKIAENCGEGLLHALQSLTALLQ
jgi:hypothetical protein